MPAPRTLRRPVRRPLVALTAAAALGTALLTAAPASADQRREAVAGAAPAWTADAADRGAAAAGTAVEVQVALDLRDEAGARAFATAVSTPGDPQYGRTLSPDAWIARFAPTQADVDAIAAAAEEQGLVVTAVPKSRLFVLLSGTAAEADAFFATRVHEYAVDGAVRLAAPGAVSLPRRLAAGVSSVAFSHPAIASRATRPAAASTACSTSWGRHAVGIPKAFGATRAATAGCGYSAAQLRATAGLAGSARGGAGQTVAVIDAFGSPTARADLARYSRGNGLPAADYAEVLPDRASWRTSSSCSPSSWAVEQSMDLEAVHAVAPAARLVYVGAADCGTGFDVAMSTVLDEGLASIVSNSWGSTGLDALAAGPLADDPFTTGELVVNLHQHLQAAGEGIGLYFASGDAGDDAGVLGEAAVDFPASSPFVTAVGGTASGLDARGRHVFSTAWGTNLAVARHGRWTSRPPGEFTGGSGGGLSALFAPPAYQRGVVPGTVSQGARAVPDVSAVAAPQTGMRVTWTSGGRTRTAAVGGTSLATPVVAAQVAIAQQRAGRALGFLNPALYAAAARHAVRDVAPSRTRRFVAASVGGTVQLFTIDRDSSLTVRRGWDAATGVGELTASSLAALAR